MSDHSCEANSGFGIKIWDERLKEIILWHGYPDSNLPTTMGEIISTVMNQLSPMSTARRADIEFAVKIVLADMINGDEIVLLSDPNYIPISTQPWLNEDDFSFYVVSQNQEAQGM